MYAITNAALTQKAAIGGRAVRPNRQKAAVRIFAAVAPVRAKLYDNILETIGKFILTSVWAIRLIPCFVCREHANRENQRQARAKGCRGLRQG